MRSEPWLLATCHYFSEVRMTLRKIRFEVKIGQFEGRFGCDLPWPGRWVTEAFSRPYFWAAGGLDIGPREAGCWATKGASRPGRWASKIGPRFANARILLWTVLSRAKIFRRNGFRGLELRPVVNAKINSSASRNAGYQASSICRSERAAGFEGAWRRRVFRCLMALDLSPARASRTARSRR